MATPVRKAVQTAAPTAEAQVREPVREAVHAHPTHTADGRVVAKTRSGVVVSRTNAGSATDAFYVPPEIIPPGWSWEWKNETVLGRPPEDRSYQAHMMQVGWEPVMMEAYPGTFDLAHNADGTVRKGPVRRQGMILMERDMRLTREAQMEEKRKADMAMGKMSARQPLDTQGTHGVELNHSDLSRRHGGLGVKKTIEGNIPRDPYQRMPIE